MKPNNIRAVQRVAVVGCGLIGMSWASLFLARNIDVVVVDSCPDSEENLNRFTAAAWPHLRSLGLASDLAPRKISFSSTIADGCLQADFVQECVPDRIETKHAVLKEVESTVDSDVVISSSSSSLMASDIQENAEYPERILVGHPMNPPHLIPMVELVSGRQTSEQTMIAAESFYQRMNRVTIRVEKEMVGHLANRLTSALYREAVHIVAEGVASVTDVDKAISYGPGMRWALLGPHLIYHLGGGDGGYRSYLDHLGPTQEARWKEHGMTQLTEKVKMLLVSGVEMELKQQDETTLVKRRDEALVDIFKLKKKYGF